jgi:hypothetical protein
MVPGENQEDEGEEGKPIENRTPQGKLLLTADHHGDTFANPTLT